MGDTLDQEMLDVKSAGDGELQVGPGVPASRCSPAIGKLGICDAAANKEAPVKVTFRGISDHSTCCAPNIKGI